MSSCRSAAVWLCVLAALWGCRRSSSAPREGAAKVDEKPVATASRTQADSTGSTHAKTLPARKGPLVVADQPPLPEDPLAGKRSEQQWREHLEEEELERQMIFDHYRLDEHHALIARIRAARERLDQVKTARQLEQTRKALAPALKEIKQGIDAIDRWKNSSHILSDYEALLAALGESYPEALRRGFAGQPQAREAARKDFDAHLQRMHGWLTRVADEDGESDEHAAVEESDERAAVEESDERHER